MKVNTSKVIAKVNAKVAKATAATKSVVKAGKSKAAPVEKKTVDPLAPKKAYNRSHLAVHSGMGLAMAVAALGREILDGYVSHMLTNREKVASAKLAASDKVLVISSPMFRRDGPRTFAFPVVRAGGDILEIKEDLSFLNLEDKAHVARTTLSALKEFVAPVKEGTMATTVKVMAKKDALAELAKAKVHKVTKSLMGLA